MTLNYKNQVIKVCLGFLIFINSNTIIAEPILYKEKVTLNISDNLSTDVKINFEFKNVKGFQSKLVFPESRFFRYKNFKAYWGKNKLITERISKHKSSFYTINKRSYDSFYFFKVLNTKTDFIKHVIEYSFVPPKWNQNKFLDFDGFYFEYILNSGSLWNNTIDEIVIEIKYSKCENIFLISKRYVGNCISSDRWYFKTENLNIDEDLIFLVRQSL